MQPPAVKCRDCRVGLLEARESFIQAKNTALSVAEAGRMFTDHLHEGNRVRCLRHGACEALFAGVFFNCFPQDFPPNTSLADIQLAFILHDIGKSDAVDSPGVWDLKIEHLTPHERQSMQNHMEVGAANLSRYEAKTATRLPQVVYDVVLYHRTYLYIKRST